MPGSLIEWLAVALALAYVLLAIRQRRSCWWYAAASSALYVAIFVNAGLPMQALLNGYYVVMAAYGWYTWGRNRPGGEVAVHGWSPSAHVAVMAALALGAYGYAALLPDPRGPWVAFSDAWVAAGSMVATWMMARKVLENWLYWVLFDAAAVLLYATQGLYATAGLFIVYVVLAVRGYVEWRRMPVPSGVA
ncbi:MAG: nicotinamide riboside transporter PnuC [Steroidobacteraceae bacterium]